MEQKQSGLSFTNRPSVVNQIEDIQVVGVSDHAVVLVRYLVLFNIDPYLNFFDTRYLRYKSNIHIEYRSQ